MERHSLQVDAIGRPFGGAFPVWEPATGETENDEESLAGEKHMAVLRGYGLVHPDGTVNRYAAQYLKTRVLALFKARNVGQTGSKKLAQEAGG